MIVVMAMRKEEKREVRQRGTVGLRKRRKQNNGTFYKK